MLDLTCKKRKWWMCDVKVKDKSSKQKLERQTGIRWHNLGTTAKQNVIVWACVPKSRQWLGEELFGVWNGGFQTKRYTKEDLERGCVKDCQARKLNREDAMDRSRWKMEKADKGWLMIRIAMSGWMFLLVPVYLGSPGQRAVKLLLLL